MFGCEFPLSAFLHPLGGLLSEIPESLSNVKSLFIEKSFSCVVANDWDEDTCSSNGKSVFSGSPQCHFCTFSA